MIKEKKEVKVEKEETKTENKEDKVEKEETKTEKEVEKKDKEKEEVKKESKSAVGKAKETLEVAKATKKKGKKEEVKIELEREYIVPLRRGVNKVPRYKRAKKAIKVLKEFIAKHMKVEDRDLNKVKVDRFLNNEIWFRGIKKPPAKIKVLAKKDSEGIVRIELVDIPEKVRFDMEREKKLAEKVKPGKKKAAVKEEKTETEEEKKDEKEKEAASVEAGLKAQKAQAKEIKHTSTGKHGKITAPVRKALKK